MIYNDEQIDFVLIGVQEADGGVRIFGLAGIESGSFVQGRMSADMAPLGSGQVFGPDWQSMAHGKASFVANYRGSTPVTSQGDSYREAFEALGFEAPEVDEEVGE